jgi:ATPase family associated with various cellular activities (AAA)/Winged helix domain, variant
MHTIYEDLQQAANIVDLTVAFIKQNQSDTCADHSVNHYYQQMNTAINEIGRAPQLQAIKNRLGLDQQQLAILVLALLPNHNVHYRQIYAHLNGDEQQNYPTLNLLISLVSFNSHEQHTILCRFIENDPLIFWRFLILPDYEYDLLSGPVKLPSDVICYLLGVNHQEKDCNRCIYPLCYPQHPIIAHPAIERIENSQATRLIGLQGKASSGRKSQALYYSTGVPLFCFDQERFTQFEDGINALKDLLRFILLKRANLYFPAGLHTLRKIPGLMDVLSQWLSLGVLPCDDSKTCCGVLIFAEPDDANAGNANHSDWPNVLQPFSPLTVSLTPLLGEQKHKLWHGFIHCYLRHYHHIGNINWYLINELYPLPARSILQLCLRLKQCYPIDHALTDQDILTLCRTLMKSTLGNLAVCDTSPAQMDDMVLTPTTREQLDEVVLHSQYTTQLITLGMRKSRGVQALFWGPSGTGKTMAAGVVASTLQRPLYKVDLSNVASKWIGETEKHLAVLFDEAEQNNGILFFDEADSVFGKRTTIESSHDKNANMGVSYLLQRMESFQGTMILATNFKGNLDAAFLRRIQLSVEFPQPGPEERLLLWQATWAEELPIEAGLNLKTIADKFELTGANIKNVSVHASVLALNDHKPKVSADHIAAGIKREYQKLDNSYRAQQQLSQWLLEV